MGSSRVTSFSCWKTTNKHEFLKVKKKNCCLRNCQSGHDLVKHLTDNLRLECTITKQYLDRTKNFLPTVRLEIETVLLQQNSKVRSLDRVTNWLLLGGKKGTLP